MNQTWHSINEESLEIGLIKNFFSVDKILELVIFFLTCVFILLLGKQNSEMINLQVYVTMHIFRNASVRNDFRSGGVNRKEQIDKMLLYLRFPP